MARRRRWVGRMARGLAAMAAAALGGGLWPQPVAAEEIVVEHQGLEVIGQLETAPGKSLKKDGVMLILHGTLAHHRMEIVAALQELLRERGVNSLAITLGLGLNARRGMFDCAIEQDHRHDDAIEEIDSWVAWLKEQGASSITLAGHDRGANQVALYAIQKDIAAIKRLVLIAPPAQTFESAEADYQSQFGRPLQPIYNEAERRISEEQETALLEGVGFLNCPSANVTAGAFADYYGPHQRFYTPRLLPQIKVPILVAVGDQDPLAVELSAAIQGLPNQDTIRLVTIPGADHFFRDLYVDALADQIRDFVSR